MLKKMKDKVWIKYYVNGVLNETVTFKDIKSRIQNKKNIFISSQLTEGDRVIVKMNNSVEAVVNYLALSEIGIISVPVNPTDSKIRIDYIIKDCKPKAIIFEDDSLKIIKNNLVRNNKKYCNMNTIIYTSGTTGVPKGVCLSLDNWRNNANSLIKHHKLNEKSILATPLPILHCNAHGLGMYATYFSKSTLVLFDKVSDNFLDVITKEKVNIASVVPSVLSKLLSSKKDFKAHKDLKYFLTAAAPLSVDLLTDIIIHWNVKVIQGYGLTESTNFSCTVPIDLPNNVYKKVMFPHPSIGVELDGVHINIKKQGNSDFGELSIKSSSNSLGYWNKDVSGRKIVDTGDIGYYKIIEGRKFFYLRGRKKELINRGGEKIYPLELESEIRNFGLNIDFHVVSINDDIFGEEIAVVVLEEFDFAILDKVPYFRRPKKVFKIKNFCVGPTGKVQRAKMSTICKDPKEAKIIWEDEKYKNRN
jgi:long-chain acyl-CoA synthetase